MSFKEMAIDASKQYYNYLKEKQKSLIKYTVTDIYYDDIYFYLKMSNSIKSLDNLLVKINSNIYYDEQFKIVSYDEQTKILQISAHTEYMKILHNATAKEVTIVVDLTFLIKNIQKFYEQYGNNLFFPHKTNHISIYTHTAYTPSEEQKNVITGALSTPMSYIWGAPGTGKTRYVLSNLIISYIKNTPNCKLLITAPTNNAVEQTLFGLLKVLKENDIPTKKVLRLGTASNEFYIQYPECCENKNIELMLKNAKTELENIDNNISVLQEELNNYDDCLKAKEYINSKDETLVLFDELIEKSKTIDNIYTKTLILEDEYNSLENELQKHIQQKSSSEKLFYNAKSELKKYNTSIKRFFYKRRIEDLELKKLSYETNIKSAQGKIVEIKMQKNSIEKEYENLDNLFGNLKSNQIKSYVKRINQNLSLYRPTRMRRYIFNDDTTKRYIDEKELFIDRIEEVKEWLNSPSQIKYKNFDYADTKDKLSNLLEKRTQHLIAMSKITNQSTVVRLNDCTVVAATLDTCIKRLSPKDYKPEHIFLDEAGYCPLIKATALLAYESQITFLGDHMQLPPICEMNDNDFKNKYLPVMLYAQSALHIEEIFDNPQAIINNYLKKKEPAFNYLVKYELNHTFRFGKELAKILAETVYSENFQGTDQHQTHIYFIDCPKSEHKERFSKAESEDIVQYILNHSDEDIGIITPYIKQRNLIQKRLQNCYSHILKNKTVYTIHGSQGREWDTVLISVVDTTNKWFMDSNKYLKVINTAVSRARKKLIILCDYSYWKNQNKQLIGKIVTIAEQIKQ